MSFLEKTFLPGIDILLVLDMGTQMCSETCLLQEPISLAICSPKAVKSILGLFGTFVFLRIPDLVGKSSIAVSGNARTNGSWDLRLFAIRVSGESSHHCTSTNCSPPVLRLGYFVYLVLHCLEV
jgi:hypothetical protein